MRYLIPDPGATITEKEFYLRSFTWGLPVNIGGAIVSLGMLATGHRPKRFGSCVLFEAGKNWGGGSLGIFLFTCKNATRRLREHEHGHSIQNCYYGPLMPFLVNIPSSARYWYRRALQAVHPDKVLPPYDSVWFEAEATRLGGSYVRNLVRQAGKMNTDI